MIAELDIGIIIAILGICFMVFTNPQTEFGLTVGIFFVSIIALSILHVLIGGYNMGKRDHRIRIYQLGHHRQRDSLPTGLPIQMLSPR